MKIKVIIMSILKVGIILVIRLENKNKARTSLIFLSTFLIYEVKKRKIREKLILGEKLSRISLVLAKIYFIAIIVC